MRKDGPQRKVFLKQFVDSERSGNPPENLVMKFRLVKYPLTASSHLKIDGWKIRCPFGMAYFQGVC